MKATYKNWYPKNGTMIVLVYTVDGNEAELARYESVKGDYYRVDEESNKPLYYNTFDPKNPQNFRMIGDGFEGELKFSQTGNVYPDNTEDALLSMMITLNEGETAKELAKEKAKMIMEFIKKASSIAKTKTVEVKVEKNLDN
jgi:hypothetical protein